MIPHQSYSRRGFLQTSLGALAVTAAPAFGQAPVKLRAVVIGHTGFGDYGNGLDQAAAQHPSIQLVAVADADPAGLQRAKVRLNVPNAYQDYRLMLEKEKPDLVLICTRHTGQHHAMALAALRAGAHLCVERPFTTTLVEADEILALAHAGKRQIAVNYQLRLQPSIQWLLKQAKAGTFGRLVEMQAFGKGGQRAGGEDLAIFAISQFDIMRAFAGEARFCNGVVITEGREMVLADAKIPADNIGPVAGTSLSSEFYFERGIRGTFVSRSTAARTVQKPMDRWNMNIRFLNEAFRINTDLPCELFMLKNGEWKPTGRSDEWILPPAAPDVNSTSNLLVDSAAPVIADLVAAIQENREPVVSGTDGVKALEMVMAVYQSTLQEKRIHFPLKTRTHPLAP
jgi:predicted dehydrogenase